MDVVTTIVLDGREYVSAPMQMDDEETLVKYRVALATAGYLMLSLPDGGVLVLPKDAAARAVYIVRAT